LALPSCRHAESSGPRCIFGTKRAAADTQPSAVRHPGSYPSLARVFFGEFSEKCAGSADADLDAALPPLDSAPPALGLNADAGSSSTPAIQLQPDQEKTQLFPAPVFDPPGSGFHETFLIEMHAIHVSCQVVDVGVDPDLHSI
jgi:hypothetical protein